MPRDQIWYASEVDFTTNLYEVPIITDTPFREGKERLAKGMKEQWESDPKPGFPNGKHFETSLWVMYHVATQTYSDFSEQCWKFITAIFGNKTWFVASVLAGV
jgi:hypothetical protein